MTLSADYRRELRRKLFHSLSLIYLGAYHVLPLRWFLGAIGTWLIIEGCVELERLRRFAGAGRVSYASLLKRYTLKRGAAPAGGYSVRSKSGTMNYVRGRAGYITTARGRQLAFVLFISAVDARRGARIGKRKVRRSLGPRGWMYRARKLEHDLIARWVRSY